jgi:hypothetical protein
VTETSNVFLRWARLEQEAKTAPRSEAASTGIETVVPLDGPDAAKNELFDAARLPSIVAITADTDIIAFLQSDIPAELTRVALRRAWMCAIRPFANSSASRKINGTLTTQTGSPGSGR